MRLFYIENTYIVLSYINISIKVVRNDNWHAVARQLSFLQTQLDIFDIRQHYVRILFISQRLIFFIFIDSNTYRHKFSSIRLWIRCNNDVMYGVDYVIKLDVYPHKIHSCSKNIRGISFFCFKNIRGI